MDNVELTAVIEYLFEGVYYVDRRRKIALWNKAAEKISGFSREEVVGKRCADSILTHIDMDGNYLCNSGCPLQATLDDGKSREAEVFLHHKEGHRLPVKVRVAPVKNKRGDIIGAVEMFRNAGQEIARRERMELLEKLAYVDELTGLANRRFAMSGLEARLAEFKRYGWPFGVLFIDIDHFKKFNDTYGHDVGDQVLKMVGKNLLAGARSFDLVSRLGGEEFIVVVANVDQKGLVSVGQRLRSMVEASSAGNRDYEVTISLGATMARAKDDVDSLLKRADELLYRAKQEGRNQVRF